MEMWRAFGPKKFEPKERKYAKRNRKISRQVTHAPVGTTEQMKMSCATFKATMENPPMAPLPKGAGRRTGGFCL
jgi:hypothetical protein